MALFTIETDGRLEPHIKQEWLLTNGLGGFAASTVLGCNTRRYHGLLCAATLPPVGRIMALNRIGEIICLDGDTSRMLEFSINQFEDRFHPRGDQYLHRFELNDIASWEYDVEGVRITKQLQLLWLANTILIRYRLEPKHKRRVQFSLLPFVSLRDFHSLRRSQGPEFQVQATEAAVRVTSSTHSLHLKTDVGNFIQSASWWYDHFYEIEKERGQDFIEDLFNPGRFVLDLDGPATMTLCASMQPAEKPDWDAELSKRQKAIAAARTDSQNAVAGPSMVCTSSSPTIRKLARAANDFVVYRKNPDGSDGTTVIAGYPWFADWGRDTMISLPGLLLVPSRFRQAAQVLSVFASYVSEGMIPNLFDDYTNEPHYNTVDASLWFVHAAFEYLRLSHDYHTFETVLQPACRAILDGYRKGTRFNIKMDEADGLIGQGDATTQLTWMDAKCEGVVFTPRQGKPVEINALWYHALVLMGEKDLAARVWESFQKVFWISPFRGLCDVVDGTRRDTSIRPNQIFAVSLSNSPLKEDQQRAVVEVVRRELLTPAGLRTLSPTDSRYHGQYRGPQRQRDEAYHNGIAWPWLIGPFLDAYLRVNADSPAARLQASQWLQPLIEQMNTCCIGQIHEICEGDAPFRPVGCFAQAWSVAEILRLAVKLGL